MKVAKFFLQRRLVVNLCDQIEFGLDWFQSFRFDLRVFHASEIVVADFLFVATPARADILRSSLENIVKHVAVVFIQYVADAPCRKSRRYRVRGQPSTV